MKEKETIVKNKLIDETAEETLSRWTVNELDARSKIDNRDWQFVCVFFLWRTDVSETFFLVRVIEIDISIR